MSSDSQVVSEQRPKIGKGMSHALSGENTFHLQEIANVKNHLMCLKKSKEIRVVGAEKWRRKARKEEL
jgi:hypothetical protein